MQADRINFLPKKLKKSRHDGQSYLIMTASGIFTLLGISLGILHWQTSAQRVAYTSLEEQTRTLAATAAAITKNAQSADEQKQWATQARDFLANKFTWTSGLKELSLLIPKTVWLSNLSTRTTKKGTPYLSLLGSAPSQRKIASFIASLETSYNFRSVTLKKSEKVADVAPDLYKFEIDVQLPAAAAPPLRGDHDKAK